MVYKLRFEKAAAYSGLFIATGEEQKRLTIFDLENIPAKI